MDVDTTIPAGMPNLPGPVERTLVEARCGCLSLFGAGRGPAQILLRCQRCYLQAEMDADVDHGGPDYTSQQ